MSSSASFSAVYNLANLTAPASGVTHSAKWLLLLSGGVPATLNMQSQMEFLGAFLGQAMTLDNTSNTLPLTVTETTYGWSRTIQGGELRTFQYPGCQNQNFIFSSAGSTTAELSVYDWPAFPDSDFELSNSSGTPVTVIGTVQVQDAIAEGYLAELQPGISPVSGSQVTPASPVSTALFPANAARKYLMIQSAYLSGTFDDVWINYSGGAASVGGADCFRIPAGQAYESDGRVSIDAINYFCATGGAQLNAIQG